MTKRILAIVLAVFMVAGLLPLGVVAETAAEHTQYEPLSEHDSAKHICEHCVATGAADTTPTWTAWGEGKTTLPTAEGHYYLTQDLNVTNADLTTGHVVLCLNGKTVTASGTEGNAADRIYQMKTSGSLTIVDCTAHTDADGNYTAGKITGGSATAIMYNSASTTTGSVNIYDGIFTGNKRSGSGGVICVQGKGQLNIYGGEFSGNTTGNSGGVLYVGSSNNKVYIENAVFKGNTATTSGGVIYNYKGSITLKNVLMTENSAPSAQIYDHRFLPVHLIERASTHKRNG